jgi:hypothetical protein
MTDPSTSSTPPELGQSILYEADPPPGQDRTGRRDRSERGDLANGLHMRNVTVRSISRGRSRLRAQTASDTLSAAGSSSTAILGAPLFVGRQRTDDDSLAAQVGGVGDPQRPSLQHPNTRARRPQYQETGDSAGVKCTRFGLRAFFTVVGAVGGALGGGAAGSLLGAGGAVGGTVAGAILGGAVGLAIGDRLANAWFGSPQDKHLAAAEESLIEQRGAFSADEIATLEKVETREWRTLLHVPSRRLGKGEARLFAGSKRVEGPKRRQKIREALLRHVAATRSLQSAHQLKKTLIEAAVRDRKVAEQAQKENEPPPGDTWLNREIAQDRVKTIQKSLGLADDVRAVAALDLGTVGTYQNDEPISRRLVEAAARQATTAGRVMPGGRERHTRAVEAIVAHAARQARGPEDFMTGDDPGARALGKIFKKYDKTYNRADTQRAKTLNAVRAEVAASADPDHNLDVTMASLVGTNDQEAAVRDLPPDWPRLLRHMANAAMRNAPGDTAADRERFARLAVLRGLTGTGLTPGRADDADATHRLEHNAHLLEQIFRGASPNQPVPDAKQDASGPQGLAALQARWNGPITRFMKEIADPAYDKQSRQAAHRLPPLRPIDSGQPQTASDLDYATDATQGSQTTQSSQTPETSDTDKDPLEDDQTDRRPGGAALDRL